MEEDLSLVNPKKHGAHYQAMGRAGYGLEQKRAEAARNYFNDRFQQQTNKEKYFFNKFFLSFKDVYSVCKELFKSSAFADSIVAAGKTVAVCKLTQIGVATLSSENVAEISAGVSTAFAVFELHKVNSRDEARQKAKCFLSLIEPPGGDPEKAFEYMRQFTGRISYRFKNTINTLETSPKGIDKLIKFLIESIVQRTSTSMHDIEDREEFLKGYNILMIAAVPPRGHPSFYRLGMKKKLKAGNDVYSIEELLWDSPVNIEGTQRQLFSEGSDECSCSCVSFFKPTKRILPAQNLSEDFAIAQGYVNEIEMENREPLIPKNSTMSEDEVRTLEQNSAKLAGSLMQRYGNN